MALKAGFGMYFAGWAYSFLLDLLSWIFPSIRVAFHHSPKSLTLKKKTSASECGASEVSLAELCKSSTPATCQLNPFLFNGHIQTAWTLVSESDVPIYYKRKLFVSEHMIYHGQFAVDFVVPRYPMAGTEKELEARGKLSIADELPCRTKLFSGKELSVLPSNDSKPMLVVLHGLSGGSYEAYLREVIAPLTAEDGGWEACVVNARGCAKSKATSRFLYNARSTWDVRQVVSWLKANFPNRPLFGLGFSIGANILTNYLGEEGGNCLLTAAVLCSNPWNLEVSSQALQRSWLGKEVYMRAMGSNMRKLFELNIDQMSGNPCLNVESVKKIRYLHEFDREYQCPIWGYPSEGAYYRDASSVDSLLAIRVPFLAIHAEDDPIAVKEALPYIEFTKTDYGVLCTTSRGGHLSWFESGGSRWFVKPATNFLNKIAKDIDLEHLISSSARRPIASNFQGHVNGLSKSSVGARFLPMKRKLTIDGID